MKKILFCACFLVFTLGMRSQVAIGDGTASESKELDLNENAVLDIQSGTKGVLFPRVNLVSAKKPDPMIEHVAGMIVYNTKSAEDGTLVPGLYYNDGSKWVNLPLNYTKWFHMPPIPFAIDATADGEKVKEKDLYLEYVKQFQGKDSKTSYKSDGAPDTIPYVPAAKDLWYYITSYDPDVFEIKGLSEEGKLTYIMHSDKVSTFSYINIVFVLK